MVRAADIPDIVALQACADSYAGIRGRSVDVLMERTGAPTKVAYAKLDKLERRGLIEYGVMCGLTNPIRGSVMRCVASASGFGRRCPTPKRPSGL